MARLQEGEGLVLARRLGRRLLEALPSLRSNIVGDAALVGPHLRSESHGQDRVAGPHVVGRRRDVEISKNTSGTGRRLVVRPHNKTDEGRRAVLRVVLEERLVLPLVLDVRY